MRNLVLRVLPVSALFSCAASVALAQAAGLPPGTAAPDDTSHTAVASAPAPLAAAEAKLAANDNAAAIALLLPYTSAHTTDARGWYDLGYAEDASGDSAKAEDSYRRAVAADPHQFESQAALGLLLARQGHTQDAAQALSAAAESTPDPPDPEAQAQANRALAHLLEPTHPDAAGTALVAALRESKETPADTLLAAQLAARQGEPDAAADAYGRVLAESATSSPDHAEAASGLAQLLITQKRYPEAEAVLRKALAAHPADAALEARLADVLVAEGKQPEAMTTLGALHQAQPNDAAVSGMLADLDTQNGNAKQAVPLYAALVQQHPQDPALLASYGDALVRTGQSLAAVPVLQQAVQLDPRNANAASSLAFAASQTHQPDLVLQALAIRSKVMSDTPATYFLAATAYDRLHQTKHAAELYRQFLSVAGDGFPDEVWQARHRLIALAK